MASFAGLTHLIQRTEPQNHVPRAPSFGVDLAATVGAKVPRISGRRLERVQVLAAA